MAGDADGALGSECGRGVRLAITAAAVSWRTASSIRVGSTPVSAAAAATRSACGWRVWPCSLARIRAAWAAAWRRGGAGRRVGGPWPGRAGDLAGKDRPDLADQAGAEVADDVVGRRRWAHLGAVGAELRAVDAVGAPLAGHDQPLAWLDGRQGADDRDRAPAAARLQLDDAEAVLGVVEGDSLDRPLERGRLRLCLDGHRSDVRHDRGII